MSKRSSSARSANTFFDRLKGEPEHVFDQIDRNAKAMLQSALTKLDVVSREEFDAQTAVLKRSRERLETLEKQLALFNESLQSQTDTTQD